MMTLSVFHPAVNHAHLQFFVFNVISFLDIRRTLVRIAIFAECVTFMFVVTVLKLVFIKIIDSKGSLDIYLKPRLKYSCAKTLVDQHGFLFGLYIFYCDILFLFFV